jgi:hypothetical protein
MQPYGDILVLASDALLCDFIAEALGDEGYAYSGACTYISTRFGTMFLPPAPEAASCNAQQ